MTASAMTKAQRMRALFEGSRSELMPFGVPPIHGHIVEAAGLGALHISGAMAPWWLKGMPDVGLSTRHRGHQRLQDRLIRNTFGLASKRD